MWHLHQQFMDVLFAHYHCTVYCHVVFKKAFAMYPDLQKRCHDLFPGHILTYIFPDFFWNCYSPCIKMFASLTLACHFMQDNRQTRPTDEPQLSFIHFPLSKQRRKIS